MMSEKQRDEFTEAVSAAIDKYKLEPVDVCWGLLTFIASTVGCVYKDDEERRQFVEELANTLRTDVERYAASYEGTHTHTFTTQ